MDVIINHDFIGTSISIASHIQIYWVPGNEGSIRETMSQQRNLRMRRDLDVVYDVINGPIGRASDFLSVISGC